MKPRKLKRRLLGRRFVDRDLHRVDPEAVWHLAVLGVLSGLMAGAAMVAFRQVLEVPQALFLGAQYIERYGKLDPLPRLLIPALAGLAVGLVFQRLAAADRQVGVVHVLHRLAYREGHLPLKNAVIQFCAASACILAGHSVGREGPAIHIGAACASWMGQRLHLPNNSIRILVGCGAAGAIAAAFNTPLAGVIFAMEVVLAEYTVSSFIPIMLASVSATTISRGVFGSLPVFVMPHFGLGSLIDLSYIVLLGILIGILSTVFVRLLVVCSRLSSPYPISMRMTLAGLATGLLALMVPEIMGSGYDTLHEALLGQLGLGVLLAVLAAKVAATALALGLGIPGGVIGPTLVIGGLAGGAFGMLLESYLPGYTSPIFYTMLGMGAMMSAALNAPLAALATLLELTANPEIIMPGMLILVTATLTSRRLFATPSVFVELMRAQGLQYANDPIAQLLRRLSVARCMERKILELPRRIQRRDLELRLSNPPTWLLIADAEPRRHILFTADVFRHLEDDTEANELDLEAIPAHRLETVAISVQSTLWGALQHMDRERVDALYVTLPLKGETIGVITRQDIERSYQYTPG